MWEIAYSDQTGTNSTVRHFFCCTRKGSLKLKNVVTTVTVWCVPQAEELSGRWFHVPCPHKERNEIVVPVMSVLQQNVGNSLTKLDTKASKKFTITMMEVLGIGHKIIFFCSVRDTAPSDVACSVLLNMMRFVFPECASGKAVLRPALCWTRCAGIHWHQLHSLCVSHCHRWYRELHRVV